MTDKYEDIIRLPHHVSEKRAKMSIHDRAAQFAPFAALTGYEDAIDETARRTEKRIEPDENAISALDERFQLLREKLPERPEITLTYFVPDAKKEGGAYTEAAGCIKKIDSLARLVFLEDGRKIPMDDVVALDGDIFEDRPLTSFEIWE